MNKMIKVIDDFLPKENFDELKTYLFSKKLPWRYVDKVTSEDDSINDFQFVHHVYGYSGVMNQICFNILEPCLNKLNADYTYRIKCNLGTRTEKTQKRGGFHIDLPHDISHKDVDKHRTSVYYINTNDGGTLFKESGKFVNSVANRMVVFDSQLSHVGMTCTNKKRRIVINFNYKIKEADEEKASKWMK